MIDEQALRELLDKQAISEQLYRYCRAVDRLDIPLGHSIWHDDATADYGADYYHGPGKGVIDAICAHHLQLVSHSHQISNILITVDGDRAGSEAYVTGTMRRQHGGKLFHLGVWGRYLDRWERRDGCWRISRRKVVFDHEETREVTPMGRELGFRRDRADPSYDFLGALAEVS